MEDTPPSTLARIGRRIELWVRNGKRFNFMILVASLADVVIALILGFEYCWVLWVGFVAYGAISLILLIFLLVSRVRGPYLVHKTIRAIIDGQSSGD